MTGNIPARGNILAEANQLARSLVALSSIGAMAGWVIYVLEALEADLPQESAEELIDGVMRSCLHRLRQGRW